MLIGRGNYFWWSGTSDSTKKVQQQSDFLLIRLLYLKCIKMATKMNETPSTWVRFVSKNEVVWNTKESWKRKKNKWSHVESSWMSPGSYLCNIIRIAWIYPRAPGCWLVTTRIHTSLRNTRDPNCSASTSHRNPWDGYMFTCIFTIEINEM